MRYVILGMVVFLWGCQQDAVEPIPREDTIIFGDYSVAGTKGRSEEYHDCIDAGTHEGESYRQLEFRCYSLHETEWAKFEIIGEPR